MHDWNRYVIKRSYSTYSSTVRTEYTLPSCSRTNNLTEDQRIKHSLTTTVWALRIQYLLPSIYSRMMNQSIDRRINQITAFFRWSLHTFNRLQNLLERLQMVDFKVIYVGNKIKYRDEKLTNAVPSNSIPK